MTFFLSVARNLKMNVFRTKFICEFLKEKLNHVRRQYSSPSVQKYRVLFFGSDDVALRSLQNVNEIYKNGHIITQLQLVTANRSKHPSLIEKYALSERLKILSWPVQDLKNDEFDIGLVVSFGHLIPEEIINKFPLGMVNVHTSLLPRWRGAAPVVHTLLNGDTTTGVTLMSIQPHQFDIGEIISQESIEVSEDITLPELTAELAKLGASILVKCIETLPNCLSKAIPQHEEGVTYARKIDKTISRIKWKEMTAADVYNLHRAIYGVYPLTTQLDGKDLRLFGAFIDKKHGEIVENSSEKVPGCVSYAKNLSAIKVWCRDSKYVCFKTLRIVGKREISAHDFYNGYMKKTNKQELLFI